MTHYVGAFTGADMKTEPHLLDPSRGQYALNCRFEDGALDSFRVPLHVASGYAGVQSLYRFGGTLWFRWNTDVDVVQGPIPDDTEERTYFTGVAGQPQYTFGSLATSGGGPYPGASRNLGVPAPESGPSAAVVGEPESVEDLEETRFYAVTWSSDKGEEGPPSPVSNMVTLRPGQHVHLTGLPTVPIGNYNVVSKTIYRTATAAGDAGWQRVAVLPSATTEFSDTLLQEQLGGLMESMEWDPPPEQLVGLISVPGGVLAGFVGKDIYMSEPYRPHAWPRSYRLTVDHEVVGLSSFPGGLIVVTHGTPYIVSVTHPAAAGLDKIDKPLACVSKRGIVDMGAWAMFPTSEGLVAIGPGQPPVNIMEPLLPLETWRGLNPSSIVAFSWHGHYVGFYTGNGGGGFIVSPRGDHLTFLNLHAGAGYTDPRTGRLYLVVGGNLVEWDAGASRMAYLWRSKAFLEPARAAITSARVDADSYPVTLRLFADHQLTQTLAPLSDRVMRSAPRRGRRWHYELEGTRRVRTLSGARRAPGAV